MLRDSSLLRVALLGLEAERHVLLLTMHHIISDGWSLGVLVRELGALYAAFVGGRPSPLPALAIQYADFASWQRESLVGERLESELAWWREELAGMPPALELPTDFPRPAIFSSRGASVGFALDRADLVGLTRLSREHGATLFMALLGSFSVLLLRYTGEDDLLVGTPVAGRTRVETEALVGLFVNTLVVRSDLSGNPSFVELLGRVRETTLSSYAHQEVPFERLVEELSPERDASRPPLVQVLFALQNVPSGPMSLPGLSLTATGLETGTAKLELVCTLSETAGGLAGVLEYSRNLFEVSTMERLAGHFVRLLEEAVADPLLRLSELPLLSSAEREQLLVEWNEHGREVPAGRVHEWIAAQAARTPEAVAVTFERESLSFGALDRRSNGLAWRLRGLGVGPEVRVGIALERSLEMVIAVLGVLKAGGAYLPLDPSYPAERLAFMVEDSGAAVILESPLGDEEAAEAPPCAVGAANTAYVIYTSGSTGRPKGVQVPHRALANFLPPWPSAPGGPSAPATRCWR